MAPLLWAALAGTPGVLLYRGANTLDAMIGHRSPRYAQFGWAAARLDDVLNYAGARLAGVLVVACAPLVGGSAAGAWRAWQRDAAAHPSPNAGVVEAAFAGALGLRLGGPTQYRYELQIRPTLGDGAPPDWRTEVHWQWDFRDPIGHRGEDLLGPLLGIDAVLERLLA